MNFTAFYTEIYNMLFTNVLLSAVLCSVYRVLPIDLLESEDSIIMSDNDTSLENILNTGYLSDEPSDLQDISLIEHAHSEACNIDEIDPDISMNEHVYDMSLTGLKDSDVNMRAVPDPDPSMRIIVSKLPLKRKQPDVEYVIGQLLKKAQKTKF